MKRVTALLLAALAVVLAQVAGAEEAKDEAVKAAMAKIFGPHAVESVSPAPLPGFSEVVMDGEVLYVSNDGHYLFQGNLIDMEARRNITEERRGSMRVAAIDAVPESSMIIFPAAKPKHTITVFTDIDCGYCRKLHSEIKQYNELGISVRYLAFPRAGIPSPNYDKTVSVWCAADRNAALTAAKAGGEVEKKSCDNPVEQEYKLGVKLGVRGTPTIFMSDGRMVPGYMPPARLAVELGAGS